MRKRDIWEWVCISGVIWYVVFFTIIAIVYKWWHSEVLHEFWYGYTLDITSRCAITAVAFWAIVPIKNALWFSSENKITMFTWLEPFRPEPKDKRKFKSQRPNIPDELLSSSPDGLLLGTYKNSFVRVPFSDDIIVNELIFGGPGCGKSTIILSQLIFNLNYKSIAEKNHINSAISRGSNTRFDFVTYCVDIKPELASKSVLVSNPQVKICNPDDRSTYGWDVYSRLRRARNDDDIYSELDVIAKALIDTKNEKNEFFYVNARKIFKEILFYRYKEGESFIEGVDYLLNGNISDVITRVIADVDEKVEYSSVRRSLKTFEGKTGEAMEGIALALTTNLDVFSRQSIRYFMDGNPSKASPNDLEEFVSIFLSIHENRMMEYGPIAKLITCQVLNHIKWRDECSHVITLIIDEAAIVSAGTKSGSGGAIDWVGFLATSRSKRCRTILAFQAYPQLVNSMGAENAKSMLDLCRVIEVLSCADPDTARMLGDWAGEYKENKYSYSDSKGGGSLTTSYDDKKIMLPSDLMSLQEDKEAIIFVKGKYYRIDVEGARYYNIPYLNEISQECVTINNSLLSNKEDSTYE